MSQITVDRELCIQDHACVAVCPTKTLAVNAEGFPEEVPDNLCLDCGHCVAICSCGAISHAGLPQEPCLPMPETLPSSEAMDNFLISRRSVREFGEQPVPRETLEALLDVARRAPTASNTQKLHWIVIQGREKVHRLAELSVEWMKTIGGPPSRLRLWDSGYDFALRNAPTVVVAATPEGWEWGKQDCSVAVTYLELAAEARGIGVCWAGFLVRASAAYEPVRKALELPAGYTVHAGLMMGEPQYSYRLVPPRKPLSVQWL